MLGPVRIIKKCFNTIIEKPNTTHIVGLWNNLHVHHQHKQAASRVVSALIFEPKKIKHDDIVEQ